VIARNSSSGLYGGWQAIQAAMTVDEGRG